MSYLPIGIRFVGQWRLLLKAQKYCDYINDHTLYPDRNGNWRLLGTCARGVYAFYREHSFVEGIAKSFPKAMRETRLRFSDTPHKGVKIAPHVYYDAKKRVYHLFFGPMIIYHFVSTNGEDWEQVSVSVKSLWPGLRDPHIINFGKVYLMYCTDYGNTISVYKSFDLYNWKKDGVALRLGMGVPRSINSSCESPCVFAYKKGFILLSTIVPSSSNKIANFENYNNTRAFYSDNPTNFGHYSLDNKNSANEIGVLDVHAPEFICENNRLFLTTCGWKNYPKPIGVRGEGVYIREIKII